MIYLQKERDNVRANQSDNKSEELNDTHNNHVPVVTIVRLQINICNTDIGVGPRRCIRDDNVKIGAASGESGSVRCNSFGNGINIHGDATDTAASYRAVVPIHFQEQYALDVTAFCSFRR